MMTSIPLLNLAIGCLVVFLWSLTAGLLLLGTFFFLPVEFETGGWLVRLTELTVWIASCSLAGAAVCGLLGGLAELTGGLTR